MSETGFSKAKSLRNAAWSDLRSDLVAKCRQVERMDGGVVDGAPENIGAQKANHDNFSVFSGGELANWLSHDL